MKADRKPTPNPPPKPKKTIGDLLSELESSPGTRELQDKLYQSLIESSQFSRLNSIDLPSKAYSREYALRGDWATSSSEPRIIDIDLRDGYFLVTWEYGTRRETKNPELVFDWVIQDIRARGLITQPNDRFIEYARAGRLGDPGRRWADYVRQMPVSRRENIRRDRGPVLGGSSSFDEYQRFASKFMNADWATSPDKTVVSVAPAQPAPEQKPASPFSMVDWSESQPAANDDQPSTFGLVDWKE